MRRLILAMLVGLGLAYHGLATGAWETKGFRTANGQLIQPGMTKTEVRRQAGAPMDRKEAARFRPENSSSATVKKGEVWMYKGNDGYYSIVFRRDRVTTIEVIPFRGR